MLKWLELAYVRFHLWIVRKCRPDLKNECDRMYQYYLAGDLDRVVAWYKQIIKDTWTINTD